MDQDFIDRVNAEWAAASSGDDVMKERTKRLSTELADNYVDETLEAYDVVRRRSGEGALGQVLAEPLGRDWVDPLRDLSLRRRLDAGLLSEGVLHVVEQLHVGADRGRDPQRRRDDRLLIILAHDDPYGRARPHEFTCSRLIVEPLGRGGARFGPVVAAELG